MLFQQMEPNERFRARREAARRRRRRRRAVAFGLLLGVTATATLGARFVIDDEPAANAGAKETPADKPAAKPVPVKQPRALPDEVRGIHVTMALASLDGKLAEYLKLVDEGMNTIQLDVKDENGEIGFIPSAVPLASAVGAARPYYRPREAAKLVHRKGVYLIGRVVTFEDPRLSEGKPELAIKNPDGSVWHNHADLGWTNPYDKRVWDYNVSIAEVAARAGFDEIQFDYVRFPTDGDVESIVYPKKTATPPGWVIAQFVHYATQRLKPLGVRVSADVFGLSATRDLGIGQNPATALEVRRRRLPDGLSVALRLGRVRARGSERVAGRHGRVVARRLPPRAEEGEGRVDPVAPGLLVRPHLRALRGEGADRGRPADGRARLPALEPARHLHAGRPRARLVTRVTLCDPMAIGDVMRTRVVTVEPGDSARLAVLRMLEESVGSVAVCDGGRLVGIFTERDVLALAGDGTDLDAVNVGDVMTRDPVTVDADVQILDAARLMGERRIRHVPVVEGGHLLGMVGIRDVLGSLVERAWQARDSNAHDTARSLFKRD